MQAFHIDSLMTDRQTYSEPVHEILRSKDMSVGLYHLEVGQHDPQGAHNEDLLFYVINGAASMQVGDDDLSVNAGSIIFVPAKVAPRFYDVTTPIDVLFVFAPAESAPTIEVHPNAG